MTGIEGAAWVAASPDGKHVYVAGEYDDSLVVFARDADTGRLAFVERQSRGTTGAEGLNNVEFVMVSPDGQHVYALAPHDDAVSVFSRDPDTGELTARAMLYDEIINAIYDADLG